MVRKFYDIGLSPYYRDKKEFWWAVPAAMAATGLIEGIFGSSDTETNARVQWEIAKLNQQAVKDTNNTNMLNVLATNENQIELQNDMNRFNKQMWNLNNQYNSPFEQLKRAQAAGINPNVALGAPVASSPVQQTTLPNLKTAVAQAPLMSYNMPVRDSSKYFEGIKSALRSLSDAPFIKEDLKGRRLDNQRKELENDALKNERDMYNNFVLYQNTNDSDDLITQGEFDKLSDKDKDKYMTTDVSGQKLPNLAKFNIRSRGAFEAWKDMRNIRNYLDHVTEDNLQTKLRKAIALEQLRANDENGNPTVVWRLAHMPDIQYKNLVESYNKLKAENKWTNDTSGINKHILQLSEKQLENAANHDFFTYIDKIGKGDMSTADYFKMFLVGLHDALSGASNFIKAR